MLHDVQAREQQMHLVQAKDAAAAEFEAAAANSHSAATCLHAEIALLQESVQGLQKEAYGVLFSYGYCCGGEVWGKLRRRPKRTADVLHVCRNVSSTSS